MPKKGGTKSPRKIVFDPAIHPYYIKFDSYNVMVLKIPSDERNTEEIIGYSSSLSAAIEMIIQHKVSDGEGAIGLASFLSNYKKLVDEIKDKISEILPKVPKKRRK